MTESYSSGNNDYIFVTTDDAGKPVLLSKERWNQHIKDKHLTPEDIPTLKKTVENPYNVHESTEYGKIQWIYQSSVGNGYWMRTIVIRDRGKLDGEVNTAYTTKAKYIIANREPGTVSLLRERPKKKRRGKRR